ncbi:pimelyl-ACP methyl ester esterase BioV [Helicobacter pametensis]|uniref:pimelyl-ACP methyl ester esterase BioV n=1 Tax=Helicobacter pametensis TaxID=95149 RepID=UPI00048056CF|nr:pimelyl-ACP methyl ester esterase BioV [Helicobacter pametensis]
MRFFSGFCFQNESELFAPLIQLEGKYTLNGFSYGGIKAFQTALHHLHNHQRIQTLNLFSPAFFQTQKPSFLKAQLMGFRKDSQSYIKKFLDLCGNPSSKYYKQGTIEELEELLFFQWREEELNTLVQNGVEINIFLGGRDQIIPPQEALEFFSHFGNAYLYKDLNHCLQYDHL